LSDAEGPTAPVNARRQRSAQPRWGAGAISLSSAILWIDRGAFIRRAMMLAAAVDKSGLHL
jgi:hypothetical protein